MQDPIAISCATNEQARRVVEKLLRRVRPCDIEVISSEPIHEIGSLIAGKSRLPAFVLTGAFVGVAAGCGLASITALLYPIHTGGMPILSFLPIGIVSYEVMMLCAILFSLAGLIWEARLLRRRPRRSWKIPGHAAGSEILVLAWDRTDGKTMTGTDYVTDTSGQQAAATAQSDKK